MNVGVVTYSFPTNCIYTNNTIILNYLLLWTVSAKYNNYKKKFTYVGEYVVI